MAVHHSVKLYVKNILLSTVAIICVINSILLEKKHTIDDTAEALTQLLVTTLYYTLNY